MTQVEELPIAGAFLLTPDPVRDERGYFARSWVASDLAARGLPTTWAYSAYAHNLREGTLRGMHYQVGLHAEHKLVTCMRGSVYDVIVDIRPDSPTSLRWHAVELQGAALQTLYVPPGLAHGYLTLQDDSLVSYQIDPEYRPDNARGVRWDDPAIGIDWPETPRVISARDAGYPDLGTSLGVRVDG